MDLVLNNVQRLICHKKTNTIISQSSMRTLPLVDKKINNFPSLKVNIIAQLEFKLVYFDITI